LFVPPLIQFRERRSTGGAPFDKIIGSFSMPLRIGFDMDGVVADLNAALVREAIRLFPGIDSQAASRAQHEPAGPSEEAPATDAAEIVPASLDLSSRQRRQLWETVRGIPNFWETLDETEPGIVSRLAETARMRRWEVMFLTSRPSSAGDTVQAQSQRWLRRLGFELPALFVVSTSRGRIASALELDVVVDDRPENCLDVTIDSKARAILIWRGEESSVSASARKLGIGGTASVGECLDLLVDADATDTDEGLMGRLRRLLRLKTPSAQSTI
jgi:hypothetical protein